MSATDEQHFAKDGVWVKPAGAVRAEVTLKGADGSPATGEMPGRGGYSTSLVIADGGLMAGGGGGAGVSSSSSPPVTRLEPASGGSGALVTAEFPAGDLPDRLYVKVGQPGGYAAIITQLAGGDGDGSSRVPD